MIRSVFIGAPWRCQITQCQSSPTGSHLKLQGPSWKKGTLYISHHKYWHQKPLHLELEIYFQTWIVHYFVIIQYVHKSGWREDRNNTFLSGFSKTTLFFSTVDFKSNTNLISPTLGLRLMRGHEKWLSNWLFNSWEHLNWEQL